MLDQKVMVPFMVAVNVESPDWEVMTIVVCTAPEPEAFANRPVPPVTVKVTVSWNISGLVEIGQETPFPETNILSPFCEVIVSRSVPTNPPQSEAPVTLVVPTSVSLPRCERWPVAVRLLVVCDVATPLPAIDPFKGVD